MAKHWTQAEVDDLEKQSSSSTVIDLARRFRADVESVNEKLKELGLVAAQETQGSDPALEDFGRAIKLVHENKWQEAADAFEKVIAESDEMQITDRARQHLSICRQHTDPVATDDDPYLQAVFEKNRGNLDEALALCQGHSGANSEEHFAYLMASIRALDGEEDHALELLATAIELEPKNRVHAFHDSDFTALRNREEFTQLVPRTLRRWLKRSDRAILLWSPLEVVVASRSCCAVSSTS